MNAAGALLAAKLEREWDADLFNARKGLAPMLGWDSYWTFRSKGSRAGFPDRTLCRERVIWAELKRELTGRKSEDAARQPSEAQREWLDRLARAGGEVYLWRPSDWEEAGQILGRRWRFVATGVVTGPLLVAGDLSLAARSAWIPGRGRRDGS